MTYCIDFFKKFKKEGNFCGLDPSQVSRLNSYMEIVELLMKQHISEEQIYTNFPVQAARPLISAKDGDRTKGLNYVTEHLKEGKKIKTGEIQSWINPSSHAQKLDKSNKKVNTVSIIDEKKEEPELEEPHKDQQPSPFVHASELIKPSTVSSSEPIQQPTQTIISASLATEPTKQDQKARMEEIAKELVSLYPPGIQQIVKDVLEYHHSYKTRDVIYYALTMFGENRKKW